MRGSRGTAQAMAQRGRVRGRAVAVQSNRECRGTAQCIRARGVSGIHSAGGGWCPQGRGGFVVAGVPGIHSRLHSLHSLGGPFAFAGALWLLLSTSFFSCSGLGARGEGRAGAGDRIVRLQVEGNPKGVSGPLVVLPPASPNQEDVQHGAVGPSLGNEPRSTPSHPTALPRQASASGSASSSASGSRKGAGPGSGSGQGVSVWWKPLQWHQTLLSSSNPRSDTSQQGKEGGCKRSQVEKEGKGEECDEEWLMLMGRRDEVEHQWRWPPHFISPSSRSPFVKHLEINFKVSECGGGVIPEEAAAAQASLALAQGTVEVSEDELGSRPCRPPRFLLWLARAGLGNSLRGFCSSFIFAALSGRTLVRFHGGPHRKVLQVLCRAFHCSGPELVGFNGSVSDVSVAIRNAGSVPAMSVALWDRARTLSIREAGFFDHYWTRHKQLVACVPAAFGCQSRWCVQTQALQRLLHLGPTDELKAVIERRLLLHNAPPAEGKGSQWAEGSGEGAVADVLMREEREERGKEVMVAEKEDELEERPVLAPGTGLRVHFDVALHIRTAPRQIENEACSSPGPACDRAIAKFRVRDELAMQTYVDARHWACMSRLLRYLARKLRQEVDRPLNIFLATDNEELRPQFIEYLSPHGNVYYSSGKVAHTAKSDDEAAQLDSMAEFYLLSRAHVVVNFSKRASTFALLAALYSNATILLRVPHPNPMHCRFKAQHYAPDPF